MNVNGRLKRLENLAEVAGPPLADLMAAYDRQMKQYFAQLRQEIAAGHVYEQQRPIPGTHPYVVPAYRDDYRPAVNALGEVMDEIRGVSDLVYSEAGYRWPDDLTLPRTPKTPDELAAWVDALEDLIDAWGAIHCP